MAEAFGAGIAAAAALTLRLARVRSADRWLGGYLSSVLAQQGLPGRTRRSGPVHVMFCLVDHFEPMWDGARYDDEVRRVGAWKERYPGIARRHLDADGRSPRYTFFYPEEQYRAEHCRSLAALAAAGLGEVEVHLHHDRDTAASLREKLRCFTGRLAEHGLLSYDGQGQSRYGFIHGNWALDNSGEGGRYCGVNNELQVLRETGCYADFTFPSAPSRTQPRTVNRIYYAADDPHRPRSYDRGADVTAGGSPSGDLMIFQGPLAVSWDRPKWFVLPRLENGELSAENPPSAGRVESWIRQGISVKGRPEWVFVKVYTHGCQEKNLEALLGGGLDDLFTVLEREYNDGRSFVLHYVTAREAYNIVRAAEAGKTGDPSLYRDYLLSYGRPRS